METNSTMVGQDYILYEINIGEHESSVSTPIVSALAEANTRLGKIEENISDCKETIQKLTPECDKLDYTLAVSSGVLCGVIDIFLVGEPGESPLGVITDNWFDERTKDFAKLCGWNPQKVNNYQSFLENKFKMPYEQTSLGNAARDAFGFDKDPLSPSNHHFRSLAHNPSILGLFYSIMDQLHNTSSFVLDGPIDAVTGKLADGRQLLEIYHLQGSMKGFELKGNSPLSKLFCGAINWFCHLISDISGTSKSKGRGMGLPSPFWTWTNDIIVLKNKLGINVTEFDKSLNELAVKIFLEGYDTRFQTTQAIPVLINELLTRFFYSVRRLIKTYSLNKGRTLTISEVWKECEPFSNVSVKRMLTVAHGSFCVLDSGDAIIRSLIAGGGKPNPVVFFMRLNIFGLGRFTISLFGEGTRQIKKYSTYEDKEFLEKEKRWTENYIESLKILAEKYDDEFLLNFEEDFQNNDYEKGFQKTVQLAQKRDVPENDILKDLSDIQAYFLGGAND